MALILALLGLAAGAAVADLEGAILGLLGGFLVGRELSLEQRVRHLERALRRIAEAVPPEPAPFEPQLRPTAESEKPVAASPALDISEWTDLDLHLEPVAPHHSVLAQADAAARPNPPAFTQWLIHLQSWITQGNPFVRVGVSVLFFGMAFLIKFAADQGMLPVELRLGAAAAVGLVLLAVGWRWRERAGGFGRVLQGGGMGVLYLVIFAAYYRYGLIPASQAFSLLVVTTLGIVLAAARQDALALALLGVTGGFLAPVLTAGAPGEAAPLFAYYALLNLGIFAIAWRKAWRSLNLAGFVLTYGVATAWGILAYAPAQWSIAEPFLLLFFVLFLGMAILYALRAQAQNPRAAWLDSTLIFGNPIVAFGLQWGLLRDSDWGMAWSALGLGVIHGALAYRFWTRNRLLAEAMAVLGTIFLTLAVPYAFNPQWSSAAWALEGAAALWVGLRQQRRFPVVLGLLLQLAGGMLLLRHHPGPGTLMLLNTAFFWITLIALSGWCSAWLLEREAATVQAGPRVLPTGPFLQQAFLIWGTLWWMGGAFDQFMAHLHGVAPIQALVLWSALTALGFAMAFRHGRWEAAWRPALLLLPVLGLALLWLFVRASHPGADWGWVSWPLAWIIYYRLLWWFDQWRPRLPWLPGLHRSAALLLVSSLLWEGDWQGWERVPGWGWQDWRIVFWGLLPAAALATLLRDAGWPVSHHQRLYRTGLGGIAALYLLGWLFYASWNGEGSAPPWPYGPLINPLDLAQLAALVLVALWGWVAPAKESANLAGSTGLRIALGVAGWLFGTVVLLRALHHWLPIPYELAALWDSLRVQAALSIYWCVVGMGLMLFAARRSWRLPWLGGAGLLGMVVVKLFVVDLANGGTLERILSFVVVGLLMMMVGYFSPLPPRGRESAQSPEPLPGD